MVIIHVIVDGRHRQTKEIDTLDVEGVVEFIRSVRGEGSELIFCDENNYPLEDTE